MESSMITGSCLCRAINFDILGPIKPVEICHCTDCRKAQGAPFGTNIPVSTAQFRLSSGEEKLRAFESSPGKERVFCGTCGSPIFSRRADKPGILRVRAGTLDNPTGAELGPHAYEGSRADWWRNT
jgi:hypothetical protein